MMKKLSALVVVILLSGCRFSPDNTLQLQVRYPDGDSRKPSKAESFACYVVTVSGSKLSSGFADAAATCLKLGKMSDIVDRETLRDKGVSIAVPAGEPISVKLFGIDKTSAVSCSDMKFRDLITGAESTAELYEIGTKSTTAFADTEIEIPNDYNANSPALLRPCLSAATSTTLSLAHVYEGDATGTSTSVTFPESIGTLPPLDFQGASMGVISFVATILGDGRLTSFTTTNNSHKRLDFLYSFSDRAFPDEVLGFTVTIAGKGGLISNSTCLATNNVNQGNGYELRVGKGNTWSLTEGVLTSTFSDATESTITLSPPGDFLTTSGGQDFLHLTVRSNNLTNFSGTPKLCSALQIDKLEVSAVTSRE